LDARLAGRQGQFEIVANGGREFTPSAATGLELLRWCDLEASRSTSGAGGFILAYGRTIATTSERLNIARRTRLLASRRGNDNLYEAGRRTDVAFAPAGPEPEVIYVHDQTHCSNTVRREAW